jgi:hypothetical protein
MATTPIWTGNSVFFPGITPFGFYDNDLDFQADADRVARYCANRLGYPLVDVELDSGSFYTCFEEAVTVYGNIIYQWQIQNNYLSLEGTTTGSNLNNALVTSNLGGVIRIAQNYGAEAGVGGYVTWYTGSLPLSAGIQDYDLTAWASSSLTLAPGDDIEIKRIFYEPPPAIVRMFDPLVGSGIGVQSLLESFGFGNMSPGVNFMIMPVSFDVQRIQAIEFNDQVRRSGYSFELRNNKLRIFPIPNYDSNLIFHYVLQSERNNPVVNAGASGSLITNPSNVPYANPIYGQLNTVARSWIYEYTLASSKEVLGYVRGKYTTIKIPNDEVTMNQDALITSATTEKQNLIERLKNYLDSTSRVKQLENKANESDFMQNQLNKVPMQIYIG